MTFSSHISVRRCARIVVASVLATALMDSSIMAREGRGHDPFKLSHWGPEEGLPHGSVSALLQDHHGFLWIGTLRGLARFDGTHMEPILTITHRSTPMRNITALAETPDGSIWVGTEGSGLIRYRAAATETYLTEPGIPDNVIRCLATSPEGTVWAGTSEAGLIRLDPPYAHPKAVTMADGLPSNTIIEIAVAGDGTVWAVCGTGEVACVTGTDITKIRLPRSRPSGRAYAVSPWDRGRVLIATTSGLFSWLSGSFTMLFPGPSAPGDYINVIRPGRTGEVWLGTYASGVMRWDPDPGSTPAFQLTRDEGLSGNYIGCLAEDREGNLWIGTEDGLNYLRTVSVRMISARDGLAEEGPISLAEDPEGTVWVGTDGAGLYNVRERRENDYVAASSGLFGSYLSTLALDHEGRLMIGVDEDGILVRRGKNFRKFPPGNTPSHANAMLVAADGSIWAGGARQLEHWTGSTLQVFDTSMGIPKGVVRALLEDRTRKLWVGTTAGLCTIDSSSVRRLGHADGLPDDYILALYQDSTGAVWVATSSGMVRFSGDRVEKFSTEQGLPDPQISCILEDGRGYLWLGSPIGIIRVARAEFDSVAAGRLAAVRALTLGVSDGMATAECSDVGFPAGLHRRNGELWFPTPRGIAVVDPGRLHLGVPTLDLIIEKVTGAQENDHTGDSLRLAPEENSFSVSYTTPAFGSSARTRFRYRLVGFDPEWIEAGTRRVAYYTKVPPGDYRFEVAVQGDTPGQDRARATIVLTIAPHFYQTTAFFAGTGIVLALILLGAHTLRVRRSEHRAKELAILVGRRTRDLQEEIVERGRVETALRESEDRQKAVLLLMPVVMYTATTPSEIDANWITANVERITGFPPEKFTSSPEFWMSRVHPDDAGHLQQLMQQVRSGIVSLCEYRWLCADGRYRWFMDSVVSVRHTEGAGVEYSGILLDISERRESEDRLRTSLHEKELLLKEIHHRVKNNLTVITSLLSLQASGSTDRKVVEVLQDAAHRVGSMASIHEQLYRSNNLAAIDFRAYTERLTQHLFRTFAPDGITLDLHIGKIFLEINSAIPCGLIVNELVTNALKHAFRGRATGRIVISMKVSGDGLHILTVRDDGAGLPGTVDIENVTTLGLRLVSLLATQLGGSARISEDHGTVCVIEFRPVPRTQPR